jgi:NtrC-family two-component system sensor histidine kinase KinB
MSLRTKLLLALIPLAVALLLLGGQALRVISEQGELSQRILKDNYRSVLAAQRMKDSLERIDSAMAFRALGQPEKAAAQDAQNRPLFDAELDVQRHNITEAGEAEATLELQKKWTEYIVAANQFIASPPEVQRSEYFARMEPAFYGVKAAAERILELNQDAMVRKSEQVRVAAERQNGLMLAATLAAALSGVLASVWITTQLLRPLSILSQAVRRVAQGDLDARATLRGDDEIAQLGKELNAMAARLGEYRRSSLGELLQAQQASQAAIDSLPDPVVILGNDSALLNVNRAAESLLHLDASVRVEPLSRTAPAIRQLLEKLRLHVTGGKGAYAPKGFDEALRLDAADGAHYLLPRAEPVYSEDSGIVGTAIILQDVTRLWRFDELKNDLVATVAHEFRTPLTSLRMSIHLCVEGAVGPLTGKQTELLHAAREDCERLQDIVDDLLDLARIQAGRTEVNSRPIAAQALFDRAMGDQREAAAEAGVRVVEAASPESSPELLADPERVGLVLNNLIGNALRHAPKGSAIELRAAPDPLEARNVRICVRDHGPGVPAEHRQRIFEKFFRVPGTSGKGVGLGLYISREIVRAHGGEMGVESAAEGGALFWFTIPAAAGNPVT